MRTEQIPTTLEYIEMVREKLTEEFGAAATDYRIAKSLGINHASMSKYKVHRSSMDTKTAVKVARFLEIDEMAVIAATEAERAVNDRNKAFWIQIFFESSYMPTGKPGKNSPDFHVGFIGSEKVKLHDIGGDSKDYRKLELQVSLLRIGVVPAVQVPVLLASVVMNTMQSGHAGVPLH